MAQRDNSTERMRQERDKQKAQREAEAAAVQAAAMIDDEDMDEFDGEVGSLSNV